MTLHYRWLGAAGIELTLDGFTLLVDPFFTRPSLWALLSGRAQQPDPALVARCAPRCDHILVTHPHYDHLLDVPEIMRQSGARASGSPNVAALLALHGLPADRLDVLAHGARRAFGPWSLEVLPNWHMRSPIDRWITGPLRSGLKRPPHLLDYRMDTCFSFLLQSAGGLRVLIGSHPAERIDIAFVLPFLPAARLRALLAQAQPRWLVPIHWDDFFRPLSRPLRPIPFKRPGPHEFARRVKRIAPGCEVLVPERFREYRLGP
jgi:L-ascorbate metabolism protein UlaG (beta-lactamase superfamily)